MSEPLILVALEDPPHARAALPVAKALSEIMGGSVRVIHVSDHRLPLPELAERLGLDRAGLRRWSLETRVGGPSAAIIDAARATESVKLILMCTHTAARRPTAILGHTALDVVRAAPCPVVLVSPTQRFETWWPSRILLAHDGSPAASAAVAPAVNLARKIDAKLIVVQVGTGRGVAPAERGSLMLPLYVDQPQYEWPSWTDELRDRLASVSPHAEVRPQVRIRGGEPGLEITQMAIEESVDLIVLAWKGEWSGEHAKTLKAVLRQAPCPVIIVRA